MQLLPRFAVSSNGQGLSKRVYLLDHTGQPRSPWHDLPLQTGQLLSGFIEISKLESIKYEISLREAYNPLKLDTRKNKRNEVEERRYDGLVPLFNYGCVPQTWENSQENDFKYPYKGDGDPLDLVEVGDTPLPRGSVVEVKVIGAMCLVDSGKTDWKIVAVNSLDPSAPHLNTLEDMEQLFPGKLQSIRSLFEYIKKFDGKSDSGFIGPNESKSAAWEVIAHCHKQWRRLVTGEVPGQGYWLGR